MREIKTERELLARLESYYLFDEIKKSNAFEKKFRLAKKYVKYCLLKQKKLTNAQIARKLSLNYGTVRGWSKQIPHLIRIASQIPAQNLPENFKWLNFSMVGQWQYKDFIKVPIKIRSYNDIIFVLRQLNSLSNNRTLQWKNNFGYISREQAFGYVLGLMISDADKDKNSLTSLRIRMGLSRVYEWNKNIGEALCYCLSIIGIDAKRVKDGKPYNRNLNGKYIWRSQLTSFLAWMKKSCLGLDFNETTTYTEVKMDWVFRSSNDIKLWMLNGIYDGDGCAYIRGWQITNAARPNQEFFNRLLRTFNIKSVTRGPKSIIETKESLRLASFLPIFRFATGKVEKTNLMVKMMKNSGGILRRDDYYKIMNRIVTLNREGLQPRDIPFSIYNEFGVGIHPRRIYTVLSRRDLFGK